MGRVCLQMVADVNPLDHQDLVIQFNFTGCFGGEPAATGRDLTRLQRAPKGPGQSTGGRGDYKIKRCIVWFDDVGIDPIMGGDL